MHILDDIGMSKKVVSLHRKRPLFLEVFLGFTKFSVSMFPLFLVKPLLHTYIKYVIYFFSVEGANGMLLNCHMCQFFIAVNLSLKNTLI